MDLSLTVTNNSGAEQTVALFFDDPDNGGSHPLIWDTKIIPDGVNAAFDCSDGEIGLGWGNASAVLAPGIRFVTSQYQSLGPADTADANNSAVLSHDNSFSIGAPYRDPSLQRELALITDRSFTVSEATNPPLAIALYRLGKPIIAVPLAPNTTYLFEPDKVVLYLTASTAAIGVAVPHPQAANGIRARPAIVSTSKATAVTFPAGGNDIRFSLTSVLDFVLLPT